MNPPSYITSAYSESRKNLPSPSLLSLQWIQQEPAILQNLSLQWKQHKPATPPPPHPPPPPGLHNFSLK